MLTTPQRAARKWNYQSGVYVCDLCEGQGVVHSFRQATINDPYPETPCDCGLGEHEPECPVCGFGQQISGYDCVACDTIDSLTDADFANLDADAFAAAVKVAVAARRAA